MTQRTVESTPGTDFRLIRLGLDDGAWWRLFERDPHAIPFHHPIWTRTLADCYGFPAFGLALADHEGSLLAGIPVVETGGRLRGRRWISLPFTDACPPLMADRNDLRARLEKELDAARLDAGIDSVEVRAAPAHEGALGLSSGFQHLLQLDPDPDTVFRGFTREVRKAIRRAERSEVKVTRAQGETDLTRTFYALHAKTRHRLGVPVQPRRYFTLLWQRIVEPGLGFVLVARAAGRPLAAGVFLAWNRTVIAKYTASDDAAWSMRPNNAIFWHAIKWACENGYSTWDFGRTAAADEGLRTFKRRWGAEELPLTYNVIGRKKTAEWSGAERAARLARPLIRHAPLFICRGIGRAFYRYAA
jgi:CelD/BcsL family acetyltransferase involved in cellulose biosynthesis